VKSLLLVGAGGHARVLADLVAANGYRITAYVDPSYCSWLGDADWFAKDCSIPDGVADAFIIGVAGVTPKALKRRLLLQNRYRSQGLDPATLIHPSAVISASAKVGAGTVILAGGIVQPAVELGEAVIVNSGAIVEHDCIIGDGVHIAPGSTVLGAATVGAAAMVGARAVVLQGSSVPSETIIKASSLFRSSLSPK